MTSTFDVLSEAPLHTEDFGEGTSYLVPCDVSDLIIYTFVDAPINVGWGAKETQFHGSIGRGHLKPSPQSPVPIQEDPNDDGLPRVSWRGDGAYFVVSSLARQTQSSKGRVLRVYSNEARLQSTAEIVAGLEPSLSWRPSGNLIASMQNEIRAGPSDTQRTGKHSVVFFERNGLPHGGFNLRGEDRDSRIKHLAWSSDSNVLAVHIERAHGDVVQLWTTGNYHW
jgi:elongator complex protein 1